MGRGYIRKIDIECKCNVIERIDEEGIRYREVLLDKPIYFTKSGVYKFRLPSGEEIIGLLTESCGRIIERV